MWIFGMYWILAVSCATPTAHRGPYILREPDLEIIAPSKMYMKIERAMVIRDSELTLMHRSYWSSYCYQGSALNPNTGCFNEITQALPTYIETSEWIVKRMCKIGWDCNDCVGSDSDACIAPMSGPTKYVPG